MEQYVEVEEVSWIKRFKNAIAGLIFAPLFVLIGFFMLRHGEIEHAKTTSALKIVVNNIKEVNEVENGDLFRYVDTVYSPALPLEDAEFGLKVKAIKLYRKVYTYQWMEKKETKEKRGNFGSKERETIYTYEKIWTRFILNSDEFKYKEGHENPKEKKYDSLLIEPGNIKIGKFQMDEAFKKSLLNFRLMNINPNMFSRVKNGVLDTVNYSECPWTEIDDSSGKSYSGNAKIKTSSLFLGKGTPENPAIGDTRIEYWYIPEDVYTIIGEKSDNLIKAQKNDSLFIHSEFPCGGKRHSLMGHFGMLFYGNQSVNNMFTEVHKVNDLLFILLRFAGLLFVVGGFALFGNPLRILFGWLPFVGAIWEKAVFKLMQVIGTFVALCISVYYFMAYNSISNLSMYDFYFGIAVILFVFFVNDLKTSVSSNGKEIHSEQF
jgi:hypothetical protein